MPQIGEILNEKYCLVDLLGEGGMGSVYRAQHTFLKKHFAIKFLHRQNIDSFQRFLLEAQSAASIGHRGIVDIYDIGQTHQGEPYIVMELLEGESLADIVRRQHSLEISTAVEIASQVLSALVAVHKRQIIHRDLKPDNIFICRENSETDEFWQVKILDFGIAKAFGETSVHLTSPHHVVGTASYMSAEQARGSRELDFRTDIWSVGAVLYRVLTGRLPFQGDSYNEVIAKILNDPVTPPRSFRPEIDAVLETIILRALDKDQTNRYRSASEFYAELQPLRPPADQLRSPWEQQNAEADDEFATRGHVVVAEPSLSKPTREKQQESVEPGTITRSDTFDTAVIQEQKTPVGRWVAIGVSLGLVALIGVSVLVFSAETQSSQPEILVERSDLAPTLVPEKASLSPNEEVPEPVVMPKVTKSPEPRPVDTPPAPARAVEKRVELTLQEIDEAFLLNRSKLRNCFPSTGSSSPSVRITVGISKSGGVSMRSIDPHPSDVVKTCIVDRIENIRFDKRLTEPLAYTFRVFPRRVRRKLPAKNMRTSDSEQKLKRPDHDDSLRPSPFR